MPPSTRAAAKHEDYTVEGGTALLPAFDVVFIVFQADAGERQVTEIAEIHLQAFCRKIFPKNGYFTRSKQRLLLTFISVQYCDSLEAAERQSSSGNSSRYHIRGAKEIQLRWIKEFILPLQNNANSKGGHLGILLGKSLGSPRESKLTFTRFLEANKDFSRKKGKFGSRLPFALKRGGSLCVYKYGSVFSCSAHTHSLTA